MFIFVYRPYKLSNIHKVQAADNWCTLYSNFQLYWHFLHVYSRFRWKQTNPGVIFLTGYVNFILNFKVKFKIFDTSSFTHSDLLLNSVSFTSQEIFINISASVHLL
jgi:hypothetical protein